METFRTYAGLTPRSLVLGTAMVIVVVVGSPFSIYIAGSSEPTWSYFPWGSVFPSRVSCSPTRCAGAWDGPGALQPAELLTIVTMGLVVSGIPIFMLSWGLAIISSPYYHATTETGGRLTFTPYLPEWTLPQGGNAIVWYFEGLPGGRSIPWDIWLSPMAWWLSVILAVYLASFCLVVIFRRQWMEHERLGFPMTELPRRMVETPGPASPLLQQNSFWIGCGAVLGVNGLQHDPLFRAWLSGAPLFSARFRPVGPGLPRRTPDAAHPGAGVHVFRKHGYFLQYLVLLSRGDAAGRGHKPDRHRHHHPRAVPVGITDSDLAGLGCVRQPWCCGAFG